jgi:hypothetical protein
MPESAPAPSSPASEPGRSADAPRTEGGAAQAEQSLQDLMAALQADRLWLLRQIDGGRWGEWRLDLAALERELGQLLDQIERLDQDR